MRQPCEACHSDDRKPRVKLRRPELMWLHQRCRAPELLRPRVTLDEVAA